MKLRILQDHNQTVHPWYRLEEWREDKLGGRWAHLDSNSDIDKLRAAMHRYAGPQVPDTVIEEHEL